MGDHKGIPHAADRLLAAIDRVGSPVCVGIDPVLERLPVALRPAGRSPEHGAAAIRAFSLGVLDAVAEVVPCVKLQSACFERFGSHGVEALGQVLEEARHRNLQVILDAKRGDISLSAQHYASAVFGDEPGGPAPDWVTVNSYFGADGIRPFLRPGTGVFALVRTSNPGGDVVQGSRLADGRSVAELVAGLVASIGGDYLGTGGYSALGAVVGATRPDEAGALRALMPNQILLVPGFGAQGGDADSVRPCFAADGRGAIVSAGRSVIYAFEPDQPDWIDAITAAAMALADQVAAVTANPRGTYTPGCEPRSSPSALEGEKQL